MSDWRCAPLRGLLVMALGLLVCEPLQAQTTTTGALSGTVTDAAGRPVLDALVSLRHSATGLVHETDSGRRGMFAVGFLQPGAYELTVEQIGYAPRQLKGIQVRAGRSREVTVTLAAADSGAVRQQVSLYDGRPVPASLFGGSQWLPPFTVREVPSSGREVTDVLPMASSADDRWSVEGLPSRLSSLMVDGMLFRPAAHPQLGMNPGVPFALSGVESAELVTNGVDVGWSGAAASFLAIETRGGAANTSVGGAAFWSGDALASGAVSSEESHNDVQGGLVVRGPLFGEGNRFSFGVEARRLAIPHSAAWPESDAASALVAADTLDLNLDSYGGGALVRRDAVAAFARADWSAGSRHRVEMSAHFAAQPDAWTLDRSGSRLPHESSDLVAGVLVRSGLAPDVTNEARLAVTRSTRERTGALQVAPTRLITEDLAFGAATGAPSSTDEMILRLTDAVHLPYGQHAIRIGAEAALGFYDVEHNEGADGVYLFGNLDDFTAGTGVFTRREGEVDAADWTSHSLSVFARDQWLPTPGLEVLLGVRVDRESVPESEVDRDGEWFRLTGLANNEIDTPALRISPRAGITWDVDGSSNWVVEAGGGLYFDRIDPRLLAQWQIDDGSARMRRVTGALSWPEDVAGGVVAPRLTMIGEDFDAPRTARVGVGLTRRLATGTVLWVSGVARRTVNLPRESDLNLLQLPVARDQYGRAVYGTLEKHGSLLAGEPGSGRRFPTYDEVALLSADGWSEHVGVSIGFDREPVDGFGFLLRYTWGRTTDNWVNAAAGAWGHAAPGEAAGAETWAEGTSDFDVPHNASAAVLLDLPLGVRLSGAYRFQSGRPFTPGFRDGIDADAGGAGTDPAFIDAAMPGIESLMSEWDCLSSAEGTFAARNSCRSDAVHALDLRAALTLFRRGGRQATIIVDAFNVLDTWHEQPDAALYLIDPAGSLAFDSEARTVDVPLLVNPDFGEPLVRRHAGRRLRLGLSVNW